MAHTSDGLRSAEMDALDRMPDSAVTEAMNALSSDFRLAVYLAESVWQGSGSLALATDARPGSSSRGEAVAPTARGMRHTVLLLAGVSALLVAAAHVIPRGPVCSDERDACGASLRAPGRAE